MKPTQEPQTMEPKEQLSFEAQDLKLKDHAVGELPLRWEHGARFRPRPLGPCPGGP